VLSYILIKYHAGEALPKGGIPRVGYSLPWGRDYDALDGAALYPAEQHRSKMIAEKNNFEEGKEGLWKFD